MTCNFDENRIALYVEGDLAPSKTQDVEAHLSACSRCRALAKDLRESQALLKSLAGETAEASNYQAVRERVLQEVSKWEATSELGWLSSAFRHWRPLWAGGLVLIVSLGLLWQSRFLRGPMNPGGAGKSKGISQTTSRPESKQPLVQPKKPVPRSELKTAHQTIRSRVPRLQARRSVQPVAPPLSLEPEVPAKEVSSEAEQATAREPEPPRVVDVPTTEPPPLVVKLLTDDPNIVIIWLVDQDAGSSGKPK
jgi:Putative zinc-finger